MTSGLYKFFDRIQSVKKETRFAQVWLGRDNWVFSWVIALSYVTIGENRLVLIWHWNIARNWQHTSWIMHCHFINATQQAHSVLNCCISSGAWHASTHGTQQYAGSQEKKNNTQLFFQRDLRKNTKREKKNRDIQEICRESENVYLPKEGERSITRTLPALVFLAPPSHR